MQAKLEILNNALRRKLPEGWEIREHRYPSYLITFNPKFAHMGTLRIDLEHRGFNNVGIKFCPHRFRKWSRANAEHFATLVSDEAYRLESVLDIVN
jgi:hypothetical protein